MFNEINANLRGKTRPHTMMTGHTGDITRARKTIIFKEEPTIDPI